MVSEGCSDWVAIASTAVTRVSRGVPVGEGVQGFLILLIRPLTPLLGYSIKEKANKHNSYYG